ncbi:hypothetical protein Tco_0752092 [Tanacetum coccineum]|uniref:Uncharacterized protein n=1 Tax=Tanacetum coccineum TaxID=301880 RepID=A0ABQ4Z742_9ASTR
MVPSNLEDKPSSPPPPPLPSCNEPKPLILSSQFEFDKRTSWAIGFRSYELPMDLGLAFVVVTIVDGFSSMCLLLPWITSLRFAKDLEHPDFPPVDVDDFFVLVTILLKFFLGKFRS